jgi:thiamine biosynthesis lipoprotein
MSGLAAATVAAIGATATVVVTDRRLLSPALDILRDELNAIDLACSRFRADSEISRVNAAAGTPVPVSPLFLEAIEVGLRAAVLTDGAVDPTVGWAMRIVGYERDLSRAASPAPSIRWDLRPVPGWEAVEVDASRSTVKVATGVDLDLGATAKALCADRIVARVVAATGIGVLVGLGGDISTAGPPPEGGWVVQLTDDHAVSLASGGPAVSILSGGLATSSTTVRRWERGGCHYHHLIDPKTGGSAGDYWRTCTVAAASAVDASVASTAAIVLGPAAIGWLDERGLPARLVQPDGQVFTAGGWLTEADSGAADTVAR